MIPGNTQSTTEEVNRILAQANLNRMRGRWHAASESCMDALCVEPANVTAHSLLGDIYADQGRLDDAIQWYCMALDLQPDSTADRSKLARAIEDRKRELSIQPRRVAIPKLGKLFRNRNADLDRTRFWRSERPIRFVVFVASVLCVGTVVAWPLVTSHRSQSSSNPSSDKEIDTSPIFLSPFSTSDSTTSDADVKTPDDPADAALLTKLRADGDLLGRGISATDVESDPRTGRVTVSYLVSDAGNAMVPRSTIIRSGIKLAEVAMLNTQSTAPPTFTMRALVKADDVNKIVFIGDLTGAYLNSIDPFDTTRTDSEILLLYTSPWWSPNAPADPNAPTFPAVPPLPASGVAPSAAPTAAPTLGVPVSATPHLDGTPRVVIPN